MLCAVIAAKAQIDEGLHWYNGQITFTARNIANKNVLMEAMDEGEEHEFILRYVKEVNQNHQVYRTDNGTHDYVNLYGVGSTMRHKKAEGLDVLCFYDDKDRLAAVISGEKEWDASSMPAQRCLTTISSAFSTNPRSASCVTLSLPVTATVSSRRIFRSISPTNLGTSLPLRMTASACRSLNSSTSNSSNKWRERNEKDHDDDICPCGNYILRK